MLADIQDHGFRMNCGQGRNYPDEAILAWRDLVPVVIAVIPTHVKAPFVFGPDGIAAHDLREKLIIRPAPDFLARGVGDHEIIGLARAETKWQQPFGSVRGD